MLRTGLLLSLLLTASAVHAQADPQQDPGDNSDSGLALRETTSLSQPIAETTSLALADLEQLAFRHNPTLAIAAARMNEARGRQTQAGLHPNPVMGYHATEVGNFGTAGQQGGFVSQRVITGGKLKLDQAVAGKEITEAHFHFHAQEQRVLSDVRIRFYDALAAEQRVDLTKELARIGDNVVQATETLLEGRQGTENDLLQAELSADEAHILLDNAINEQHEAWRKLAAVLGIPTMELTPLNGSLDQDLHELDWNQCSTTLLSSHPELNAARTRAQRAGIAIRRARKEPIPDVDVSVSLRRHKVTDYDVANIQVGIPIPVFDRNQGNIRSAEARWVAACHNARRLELQLQEQLATAFRRYTNARQQVTRYQERMVPRAERSLKLVTDGYQKGQVEYLTMLTTQRRYHQISLAYLRSLQELRTAASVIEGQLLTDNLAVGSP